MPAPQSVSITDYKPDVMPGPFQLTVPGEKALISGYVHSALLSTLLLGIFDS